MLIVGLGNPGSEYEKTRHNTGRILLELLAKKFDFSDWKEDMKLKSLKSKGEIGGEKFDFLLPNTFMNNSGNAVCQIINDPKRKQASNGASKNKLKNLVVIYDDMDLPIGSLKISFNKSSGGHNGLESIIKKVKSKEFVRIRVGVSPTTPTGKMKKPSGEDAVYKFLLGSFKEDEIKKIKSLSKKISDVLVSLSADGKDKTMSVFN